MYFFTRSSRDFIVRNYEGSEYFGINWLSLDFQQLRVSQGLEQQYSVVCIAEVVYGDLIAFSR